MKLVDALKKNDEDTATQQIVGLEYELVVEKDWDWQPVRFDVQYGFKVFEFKSLEQVEQLCESYVGYNPNSWE
jgi:hypothetical protein